jgi:hypothetical protein
VPPPTPDPEPTNFALRNFNEAVASLKVLSTKPLTTFDHTPFSADDLEKIEHFIGDMVARKRTPSTDDDGIPPFLRRSMP